VVPSTALAAGPYRIQPGDLLDVKFAYHTAEDEKLRVRPDGTLALAITGDIEVKGLTIEEASALIRERSSRLLRNPSVSVVVAESVARAYIGGEVSDAGFVALSRPMTVYQAVLERGGFTRGADLQNIAVISPGKTANEPRHVRRVNVVKNSDGKQPPEALLLAPDDVVVVPKSGIASANQFVDQWIDGMTPQILRGVRVNGPGTNNN
jgi:protein involved in polysaccharide export with SLBB domain